MEIQLASHFTNKWNLETSSSKVTDHRSEAQ